MYAVPAGQEILAPRSRPFLYRALANRAQGSWDGWGSVRGNAAGRGASALSRRGRPEPGARFAR